MSNKAITVFEKVTGINNVADPERLVCDPSTGIAELAAAVNVEVDNTGRIKRRKGYEKLRSESSHSIFAVDDVCLYVSGDAMFRLYSDGSRNGIRSGLVVGAPMDYVAVDDKIYHCNGFDNGVFWISDNKDHVWIGEAYVGPPLKYGISAVPPVGELLGIMGGYMLIASKSILYISMQFAYSWYRLSKDVVPFPSTERITMLKPVVGGVWLGTSKAVYFLDSPDPNQWKLVLRANSPVCKGTATYVSGAIVGDKVVPGVGVIWTGADGIYFGNESGDAENLTSKKLSYDIGPASVGAGVVFKNQYVVSIG